MRRMWIGWLALASCIAVGCSGQDAQLGQARSAEETGDAGHAGSAGDAGNAGDAAASTFECGNGPRCDDATQLCEHVVGGAPPGVDFFECVALPVQCVSAPTCACVTAAWGPNATACSSSGGHITVDKEVP